MFDKLLDLLVQFAGLFKPFVVLNPCLEGVICRWGTEVRKIGPGFHWIIPFGVEEPYTISVATRVDELAAKPLVTKDGKTISCGVVVTYRVHDASKALFSVWEPIAAVSDAVQGEVAAIVSKTDYADLIGASFTDSCRKRGFKYGFEIDEVRIATLSPTRSISLIQSSMTD